MRVHFSIGRAVICYIWLISKLLLLTGFEPLNDPRVQSNESYLTIILLSRVVTQLGTLEAVTPHVIENLFVADLDYLQDLYERVNGRDAGVVDAMCPECGEEFQVQHDPRTGSTDV